MQFYRNLLLAVVCSALATPALAAEGKKKIVFIAGKPSHAYAAHEHNAGCDLLTHSLKSAVPGLDIDVVHNGWPTDETVLDGADTIVMYCDGGGGHMVLPHKAQVDALAKKGCGIVCLHYAVEVPKDNGGPEFLNWIGGYFEENYSVNPTWTANFDKFPDHPITRGVKPFAISDEWYYHMRFRPGMQGVTPILTTLPPADTLSRPDGPHSGNPDVRRDVLEKKEPQHVAWASENPGGGRGFGFTGGHDHWNWGEPNFRRLVLNAILWTAKVEVPAGGVSDKPVTLDELIKNQDEPIPGDLDREAIRKRIGLPAGDAKEKAAAKAPKPIFASKLVSKDTPGHAVDVDVDIQGLKQLFLVVTDGGDGIAADWVAWCEPRLVGPGGEKKLTDLKWKQASSNWGNVYVNRRNDGGPLNVDGKSVEYGIGTHANSLIVFDLPAGYQRFKARGGLDDGGTSQGGVGSTVNFAVYAAPPGTIITSDSQGGATAPSHDSENAVAGLDVTEDCAVTLFSSEPQISNVTSIDIDHLGRVWAAEVKNYRRWNGSRPEGDRILVLEDTDGDGRTDKQTVFYQGRDIDSAHGICVLGNRVIVSASDKVQVFYDDDGDLRSDRQETLFTVGGAQHDHGIHAFSIGPDGKLYFNFGNEGKYLKDKDGKPIIDAAGNEVTGNRKPYQEGMIFRCNLDGSQVETLAWNFRNNWEVTVDSLGNLWQSDNDDDGNRGVRINYILEFGNYGYKDELTGAGWNQPRTNWETEIPRRHWHLNDPGTVPNLLQTGAGAPTGITVYEGTLLPKIFQNQMIHCEPLANVCRAYPITKSGAGFTAVMENVLFGARDNWFRPSDVCVAPDGSLFVADWYDPGVGGHNQQEVDKGRIFRVAPTGAKYSAPKFDFATAAGAAQALKNPNPAARYLASTALKKMGKQADAELAKLYADKSNSRVQARALWVRGQIEGEGPSAVATAIRDADPDLRIVGVRLAYQLGLDPAEFVQPLLNDPDPAVRRQCAIALRHSKSTSAAELWAELATRHDGEDRWYLEALGIGADRNWDAFLDAYLAKVGDQWNSPAGRDIIWRSRAGKTPELLAKIINDPATTAEDRPRYLRAFDFQAPGPAKNQALVQCLVEACSAPPAQTTSAAENSVIVDLLLRLDGFNLDAQPRAKGAVLQFLKANPGSEPFFQLVERFQLKDFDDVLLELAVAKPAETSGVKAADLLIKLDDQNRIAQTLAGDDADRAAALVTALGNVGGNGVLERLTPLATDAARPLVVRSAAVKGLGKAKAGQTYLLELAKEKKLSADITFTVANVLLGSALPEVREEAAKYLQLPAGADAKPLPPLAELVKVRGNASHGKELFNDKATCAKCHIVAGQGRDVGPNLSEIGSKLSKDALLISILDPNAGISHNYETYLAVTDDGRTISGLLVSKTDDEVMLKDATAIVHTLKRSEIEDLKTLPTSLMPADLQKLLSGQDLIDVVEYLMTLKKS
jgi:putative membrane-bound dehydrogenase-like protein